MVQILGLVGIVVVALYAEIIEGIVVFEAELSDKLFSHAIEAEFLELYAQEVGRVFGHADVQHSGDVLIALFEVESSFFVVLGFNLHESVAIHAPCGAGHQVCDVV